MSITTNNQPTHISVLTAEQISEALKSGRLLRWHPNYHREEWCDGPEPLQLTSIMKLSVNSYYIGYICSEEGCRRCKHPVSTWSDHHKLIRADGLDLFGYGEEIQISKKKTEVVLKDQPVFAVYEEEAWLFENKDALAQVKRGLEQLATGQTRSLGSFAEFLTDEDE